MIEDNTIVFFLIFVAIFLIFYLISGKNLRPQIILDPYVFFYLMISSILTTHLVLFFDDKYSLDPEFIFAFSLSFLFFTISFFSTSYILSSKLGILFESLRRGIIKNRCCIDNRIYLNKIYFPIFGIGIIIAIIFFLDAFERFSTLSNLHSDTALYITNNPTSRYIGYLEPYKKISSAYFMMFLLLQNSTSKIKKITAYVYLSIELITYSILGSRASLAYFFMPLGFIALFLYHTKNINLVTVKKIQFLIVFFSILLATFMAGNNFEDIFSSIYPIMVRLFVSSEMSFWYHIYGTLRPENFRDYDFSYYVYPLLKIIGLVNSQPGIGIYTAELAGNMDLGKGPVPGFFYESYLISKSFFYSVIYSSLVGFSVPFFRYFCVVGLVKLIKNGCYLFIALFGYYYSDILVGDFWIIYGIVPTFIFSSLIFYCIFKQINVKS